MIQILVEALIKGVVLIGALFVAGGFMTFIERRIMARLQLRVGPNRVGPFGLLQPIADGIKLLTKERFQPASAETFTYWLAPAISLFISLFIFVVIPFGETYQIFGYPISLQMSHLDTGILFLLAFSSLSAYGIVLAGWSSNNRYSLLGGIRGTAQFISYEVPMSLSILTVILATGSLNLNEIVEAQQARHWFILTQPVSFIVYLITAFAETNRAPFDLTEAEHELTGGFHTEYGGMKFAMFYLAEYISIIAVSSIAVTLFFGGWHGPYEIPLFWFFLKIGVAIFVFMLARVVIPRFRYDQLLSFSWKVLLPIAIINLIVTAYLIIR